MATRGRRYTDTLARPIDASTPRSAGPRSVPECTTTAPGSMSSPARRTLAPEVIGTWTTTVPSRSSVSSTRTTVSAPCGTTEPVKILAAVPASTGTSRSVPAGALPITRRRAGAVRTSAPRTAKPSMPVGRRGTARVDPRQRPTGGRSEEHAFRAEHWRGVQHRTQRLADGDHAASDSARPVATQRAWTCRRRAR